MSNAFSSSDAEEGGNGQYETLEEYIFQTDRDKENEVNKAMRFRDWQQMQLRIIKNKLGTNSVEVVARSYLMGLSKLREDYNEEVDEASEMLTDFLMVVGTDPRNSETVNHIAGELSDYQIREPTDEYGNLSEPKNFKIRESAVSEVENTYVQDAFFGPWIHRYVASLGFLESELVTEVTESKLSSFGSAVSESMEVARDEIESLIMDYISMSQAHWIMEGLDEETHSKLEDVVSKMDTDRKEACERLLDQSEIHIEKGDNTNNE